ncbi:hypothetical protein BV20DRAFT_12975 [Pilatotrama ljubarskyi]|nr:hypothetical protein BV20DRAFT_12975 [Pilatotrama ljubarskyi]
MAKKRGRRSRFRCDGSEGTRGDLRPREVLRLRCEPARTRQLRSGSPSRPSSCLRALSEGLRGRLPIASLRLRVLEGSVSTTPISLFSRRGFTRRSLRRVKPRCSVRAGGWGMVGGPDEDFEFGERVGRGLGGMDGALKQDWAKKYKK